MAYNVYHNPHNVLLDGSNAVTGVVSVSVGTSKAEIHAAADEDTHETVARHGTGSTRGSVAVIDPTEAEALEGLQGDLTFDCADPQGGSDMTVTISEASFGSWDMAVGRDGVAVCSVTFIAESAPVTS